MAVSKQIKEVSIGGNAVNNPPNYSWTTYSNYPGLDLNRNYMRLNIIFFDSGIGVNLYLTGLVVLDNMGQPLIGPTDLVYMPCPPVCD